MKTLTTVFLIAMLISPLFAFGHTPLDGPEGDTFYGDPSNMQSHANWKTDIRDNGVLLDWNFRDHSGVRLEGNSYVAHTHDESPKQVLKLSKQFISEPEPERALVSEPTPVVQGEILFVTEPEPESAQQVARSSPQITSIPVVPNLISIQPASVKATEIMFRDYSRSGGGDRPQWIELYNFGGDTDLAGYSIVFHEQVHRRRRTPIDDFVVTFGAFPFPSNTAIIVSNKQAHYLSISGVDHFYVDTDIANLKQKWTLSDASGSIIYKRTYRWNWGIGGHNENIGRVPVEIIPTEPPAEGVLHYYGSRIDSGTPGHHETVVAAAPSLQRPKLITMWAELRKQ